MNKKMILGAVATSAATLVGCSSSPSSTPAGTPGTFHDQNTGAVEFKLDFPNGTSAGEIVMDISCVGFTQTHTIDLSDPDLNRDAAFGGIAPGACTVSLVSDNDCEGEASFTVVADTVADVPVVLACPGTGEAANGGAKIDPDFEFAICDASRFTKIYAIPSNVEVGATTTVEVELNDANVVGAYSVTYATANDATHTASGAFAAAAACAAGSDACTDFLCSGVGAAASPNELGYPQDGVYVNVTVQDEECTDTEQVWVDCIDTGVVLCGNGVIDPGEVCDGDLGLTDPAVQECDSVSCTIVPICGNGIVEAGEDCATCEADVDAVTPGACAVCGDGVLDAGEDCTTCEADVLATGGSCEDECIACISSLPGGVGDFYTASCDTDALCSDVMACITTSSCFLTPNDCYCGIGVSTTACSDPAFVPEGPCATEMATAAENGGATLTNAEVLQAYFDPSNPLGVAGVIALEAYTTCGPQGPAPLECPAF